MITMDALAAELGAAGLVASTEDLVAADAQLAGDPLEAPMPWYLRLIVGAGGWLTAVFVLFWLGFIVVCALGLSDLLLLSVFSAFVGVVGLALSFGAAWLPELRRRGLKRVYEDEGEAMPVHTWRQLFARTVALDFAGQVGAVGTVAGVAGFALGLVELFDAEGLLVVLFLQCVLLLAHPHFVVRFLAASGAPAALMGLEAELGGEGTVTVGLATVALVGVWLARPVMLRTGAYAAHSPIGHGLAAFVLLAHVASQSSLGLPVVYGVVAATLMGLVMRQAAFGAVAVGVAVLCTAAAAAVTAQVPGVMASLVVLVLGARAGDRVLQGGAVLGLLGYGVYDAAIWQLSHDERFAALWGLGLVFAVAAGLLRRSERVTA